MATQIKETLLQTQTTVQDAIPSNYPQTQLHPNTGDIFDDPTYQANLTLATDSTSDIPTRDEATESTEDTAPVGNFMFCDNIKRYKPPKFKAFAISHQDDNLIYTRFTQPLTTNAQTFHRGHMPGRITVSSLFHMESNREKRGLDDDGLDDTDLTAADGVIRAKKDKVSKRHTLAVDNVKITKGEFIFPHRTYKPKVQIAYRVPAGMVPQAVMAERLHRIYRKMDVNIVLQTLGVELSDLIPPCTYGENNERFYEEMMFRNRTKINGVDKREVLARGTSLKDGLGEGDDEGDSRIHKKATTTSSASSTQTDTQTEDEDTVSKREEENEEMPGDGDVKQALHPFIQSKPPFSPQFPLSYFDNTEYDIRSGEDWCRLGWEEKERRFYPLPAKAFLPLPLPQEKRVNLKAPSQYTMDEILRKTPRLEGFRQWLLRERFDRQIRMVGLEPAKVTRLSPSELEMNIVARLGSTVHTKATLSDDSLTELHRRASKRQSRTKSRGVLDDDDAAEKEEGSDEDSDEEASNSDHALESVTEVKDEDQLTIVYKLRQLRRDDEGSDEGDKGIGKDDDAKKSVSLLSDVFSDLDTMTMIGSDMLNNIQRALGMEEEETEFEEMEDDSQQKAERKQRGLTRPARSYFMGDYGLSIPDSPDIDPFEDDMEQYVIDFEKMKKVHIYDWRWVDVAVFDYHPSQNKYFVRSISNYEKGHVYAWVSKIHLLFDAEDPNRHGQRIKDAVKRRIEMESIMRYNLYVDCLPMLGFPDLEEEVMKRIVDRSVSASNLKVTEQALRKVQREINLEYQRTIAEEKFQVVASHHHKTFHPWVQFPDKTEACINTTVPGVTENGSKSPEEFNLAANLQNFDFKVNSIQKATVIYTEEGWKPYDEITKICMVAKEKSIILTEDLLPMHLDDWHRMQIDNITEIKRYLEEEWFEMVVTNIKTNFEKTSKSWYNLTETNYDVYLLSKLCNFLQLIKLLLQDTMRSIIKESCLRFMNQVKCFAAAINPTTDWSWGDDLVNSVYPPPKDTKPIWILEMFLDAEGPKYMQPLYSFYRHAYNIYSKSIQSCSQIPTLLSKVMPQMMFAALGFLQGVEENEVEMMEIAHGIVKYTKLVLLPLESYIRKFQKYKEVWSLDISAFVKKLEESNPTAHDIKKLVEQNKRHKERLEREIPVTINITAFKIVVEHVRETILKKKTSLINSILDSYAYKLRKLIQKVNADYKEMEKKLTLRSDDIEEVMELKGYVEIVPSLVARFQIITNAVIKDYEVFDHFMYQVSNDDVNEKWKAALNANRMQKLGKEATKWLEEDYERLLKVQQQDLSSLSDQVDTATLTVAGLAAFTEVEKAPNVCTEIKRIWGLIQDLQEQSELLNRRQKIFALPPAGGDALNRLTRDIEPFKNLWFTVSDWLTVQENLYSGMLDKVEMDQVQDVITEGSKVIGRCIKYFAGADQIQHIAKTIKYQLDEFRPLVPLIATLKKTELRQRHLQAITDVCGYNVMEKTGSNFKKFLETGAINYVTEVAAIGDQATKEYEVESGINKMIAGMAAFNVKLIRIEEYKLSYLKITPEMLSTIKEFIGITTKLVANPFNKPFEEKLRHWDRKITLSRVYVDKWLELQTRWLQMQPTFVTPDAPQKMPVTYKLYEKVKRIWERLCRLARDTSEILELCSNNTTIASLQQFSLHLGTLEKSLAEFLRPKGSDSDED